MRLHQMVGRVRGAVEALRGGVLEIARERAFLDADDERAGERRESRERHQ
jgi:hypothetical protein